MSFCWYDYYREADMRQTWFLSRICPQNKAYKIDNFEYTCLLIYLSSPREDFSTKWPECFSCFAQNVHILYYKCPQVCILFHFCGGGGDFGILGIRTIAVMLLVLRMICGVSVKDSNCRETDCQTTFIMDAIIYEKLG